MKDWKMNWTGKVNLKRKEERRKEWQQQRSEWPNSNANELIWMSLINERNNWMNEIDAVDAMMHWWYIDKCIVMNWQLHLLTMHWWCVNECIDNALMKHRWCIIEALKMHWRCIDGLHSADDALWMHWLIHWWCIDKCTRDALMMKGRTEWKKLMHLMQ